MQVLGLAKSTGGEKSAETRTQTKELLEPKHHHFDGYG